MPLGHLGLNVPDLTTARVYYGRLMPSLGYASFPLARNASGEIDQLAYRPADGRTGTYLFFYPATEPGAAESTEPGADRPQPHDAPGARDGASAAPGLQHLAFIVPTRSEVRAVHQLVRDLGSTVVHEPQSFPQYPPPYYATFWLDPFGVMLEAVCHHDRD